MRRTAMLLVLPAALAVLPADAASAACVSSSAGVTVCPTVFVCLPGSIVSVSVVGVGTGTASCGGAVADCISFRVSCSAIDTAQSTGTLTCTATHKAVATCTVTVAGA